jgi:hypothetical protein
MGPLDVGLGLVIFSQRVSVKIVLADMLRIGETSRKRTRQRCTPSNKPTQLAEYPMAIECPRMSA